MYLCQFKKDISPMKQIISITDYFETYAHLPIVDVRSPGEYEKGHIPGASNIALFSDEERAVVGTAYKQVSKEKAMELGYEFVTPKLDSFIVESQKISPQKEVIIHCWRGGMRSQSFAKHLHDNGFEKVYVLDGGYKAFRNYALNFFESPFHLKILGGYTGSGKTEILHFLKNKGQQVIDLEGLGNHRGSAFGGIDLPKQPTTEQFENNLFYSLNQLNREQAIWLEDESNAIGKVNIPIGLFDQMRAQTLYFLQISQHERAKHLVNTYGQLNPKGLEESIQRISKRLGLDNTKIALQALRDNDYLKVAELSLVYYDKYYLRGLLKRDQSLVVEIKVETTDHAQNADRLMKY